MSLLCIVSFAIRSVYANRGISQDTLSTWQEQLEYARNNMDVEGDVVHLKLLNYTYKGMINSQRKRMK